VVSWLVGNMPGYSKARVTDGQWEFKYFGWSGKYN